MKVADWASWAENYGVGGELDGDNYTSSTRHEEEIVTFSYDLATHAADHEAADQLTAGSGKKWPTSWTLVLSRPADLVTAEDCTRWER